MSSIDRRLVQVSGTIVIHVELLRSFRHAGTVWTWIITIIMAVIIRDHTQHIDLCGRRQKL